MQPQPYYLALITLFALLAACPSVSATLNPPQRPIRGETKILPAYFLLQASSRQNEQVAQGRGDESGKVEALSVSASGLVSLGKIDQALKIAQTILDESSKPESLTQDGSPRRYVQVLLS